MSSRTSRIERVLRGAPFGALGESTVRSSAWLALLVLGFSLFYGAVMGSYSGLAPGRLLQLVYSSLKVPLLLLVTFAISLPSYFVLGTLMGLRSGLAESIRALLAAQAGLTVVLAALAPYTALWYASSADYDSATRVNLLMFGIAALASHVVLRRHFRPLIARNRRHLWLLRSWLAAYGFVGIQMAWVLRPFIGDPDRPVQFFREEAWGNAYVVVANLLWRLVSR